MGLIASIIDSIIAGGFSSLLTRSRRSTAVDSAAQMGVWGPDTVGRVLEAADPLPLEREASAAYSAVALDLCESLDGRAWLDHSAVASAMERSFTRVAPDATPDGNALRAAAKRLSREYRSRFSPVALLTT